MILKETVLPNECSGNAWHIMSNTIDMRTQKIMVAMALFKDVHSKDRNAQWILIRNYQLPYELVGRALAALPDGRMPTGAQVVEDMVQQYLIQNHPDFDGGVIS